MAVAASKGSKVVRQFREQEDRKKAQDKHWELAGSNLGNLMGIKDKPDETADPEEEDDGNYKESHQFASHMKDTEAVSDFAMEKSIKVCFLSLGLCHDFSNNVSTSQYSL